MRIKIGNWEPESPIVKSIVITVAVLFSLIITGLILFGVVTPILFFVGIIVLFTMLISFGAPLLAIFLILAAPIALIVWLFNLLT